MRTFATLWIEAGGAFAQAAVRGGGEYGEAWHLAAVGPKKVRAFDDFAASAKYLIARGHATRRTLCAYGHSFGATLVAATLVAHPGLFGAAVVGAGGYDVLRAPAYSNGSSGDEELGRSTASVAQFRAVSAWAPLDHIRSGTVYPALLIVTRDGDDRVSPANSYKFAAAMQHAHRGTSPILLDIIVHGGHDAFFSDRAIVDSLAFAASQVGLREITLRVPPVVDARPAPHACRRFRSGILRMASR